MASKRKPQGTGDPFVDAVVELVDQELGPEPAVEPASHTPARAIPTVAERIELIADMMERLEWVRGKSAPLLAERWGLAVNTVEQSAAEAHRRVVGDKDEAVRDITAGARRLMKMAIESGQCRDFAAVANLLADVSGAKAPTRQEVAVETISPATAREVMADLFGPVTPQDSSDVIDSEE